MAQTIAITEEGQAFFEERNDPTLRERIDELIERYSEAMGDFPPILDAFQDPDTGRTEIWIGVEVDPALADHARERFHTYMREWFRQSDATLRREIAFGIRYR